VRFAKNNFDSNRFVRFDSRVGLTFSYHLCYNYNKGPAIGLQANFLHGEGAEASLPEKNSSKSSIDVQYVIALMNFAVILQLIAAEAIVVRIVFITFNFGTFNKSYTQKGSSNHMNLTQTVTCLEESGQKLFGPAFSGSPFSAHPSNRKVRFLRKRIE